MAAARKPLTFHATRGKIVPMKTIFPKITESESKMRQTALDWLAQNKVGERPLWTQEELDRPDFAWLIECIGVYALYDYGQTQASIAGILFVDSECVKKRIKRLKIHLNARRRFLENMAAPLPSLD